MDETLEYYQLVPISAEYLEKQHDGKTTSLLQFLSKKMIRKVKVNGNKIAHLSTHTLFTLICIFNYILQSA